MGGYMLSYYYCGKKYMKFILGMIIIMMLMFSFSSFVSHTDTDENSTAVYFLAGVVFLFGSVIMYIVEIVNKNEGKLWKQYVIATPDGVRSCVGGMYLYVLAVLYAGVIFSVIFSSIASIVTDTDYSAYQPVIIAAFFMAMLTQAIELPFYFRFGVKRGNSVKAVLLLLIIFIGLIYLLFGDLSIFGSSIAEAMDRIIGFLSGESESKVLAMTVILTPYAVIALYALSCKLSCLLYTKGALNDD